MKNTAGSTREQIVDIARELIQTRSYLGFSFQDVAERVGLRKASLYHHFPTKESLAIEVLEQARQRFIAWFDTTPAAPEDKLAAYFTVYRDALQAGQKVCPAGALAAGWDCIEPALQEAGRGLRQVQVDWLGQVLKAQSAGSDENTQAQAAYIFTVCQGALLTARMSGKVEDFDAAMQQLRHAL